MNKKNNNNNNNTNFWISYADLMAGLLFVFILLIGAIIVKYSLLENESGELERELEEGKIALKESKNRLIAKDAIISDTLRKLEKTKLILSDVSGKLKYNKDILKKTLANNDELRSFIIKNKEIIEAQQEKLYKKDELVKDFMDLLKDNQTKLSLKDHENVNLKKSLEIANLTIEEKKKKLENMLDEILAKENLIKSIKHTNSQLDNEIKVLLQREKETRKEQELFAQDLKTTKEKIKNLTGIKVKVITILKESLGKDMEIDPNGAIRLSSKILFDEGQHNLKDTAKIALKKAVFNYFNSILENKEINQHIDKVIIEGHTNSKGSFLYNLNLSQKRAFAVMDFLLSLDFKEKEKLKNLVVASGRSFLDPIYNENNEEDKEASRRIEIKFNLKNEEAFKEIEAILDDGY